jgi:hypothetical protein
VITIDRPNPVHTDPQYDAPRLSVEEMRAAVLERQLARIEQGRAHVAQPSGEAWENRLEYQHRINWDAWRNSLDRAQHTAYLAWRIDDRSAGLAPAGPTRLLGDHQHPAVLRGWVDRLAEKTLQKKHLVCWGGVGGGKTTAAVAAGTAAVQAGVMSRYVRHTDYLKWLRPDQAPAGMSAVKVREFHDRAPLLILDELCGDMDGMASEFARQESLDLLDKRRAAGLSTVVCTNVPSAQVARVLGDRFMSRLGQDALPLEFKAPDQRAPVSWG